MSWVWKIQSEGGAVGSAAVGGHMLRRDYDAMRLVDKKQLPLVVLLMKRERAVKWTTVI